MPKKSANVAVVGAGAWGTAIAVTAANAGSNVTLWALEKEVVESVNKSHENKVFLAGCKLPKKIKATGELKDILNKEAIFLVTPSQFVGKTCEQLKKLKLPKKTPLVLCSKGIDQKSLKLMSEVVEEILPNPIAILSGPTFADEIASNLPASATVASRDPRLADKIGKMVSHRLFKVHYSKDIIGSQISGSAKNVLAIACGIAAGRKLGQNAQAALITGGLAEIRRLCIAKGGRSETIQGLCGLGDVILTCGSQKSRNMSLGFALGQGKSLEAYMKSRKTVAEGVYSADSVTRLAKKLGVDMPIMEAVNRILHHKEKIDVIVEELISNS
ncbi:MAG: NAD(P)-dependent glycerol-3-phosphate dehydrogenase [Proteobacteria bacterium]|nr:NAD(P)-dependent glycerol-3-phosphate dehydrogenase [Pseudomonadota bacterium]